MNYATLTRQAPGTATRTTTFILVLAAAFAGCLTAVLTGCQAHPQNASSIPATPLATIVEQVHRQQAEHAAWQWQSNEMADTSTH